MPLSCERDNIIRLGVFRAEFSIEGSLDCGCCKYSTHSEIKVFEHDVLIHTFPAGYGHGCVVLWGDGLTRLGTMISFGDYNDLYIYDMNRSVHRQAFIGLCRFSCLKQVSPQYAMLFNGWDTIDNQGIVTLSVMFERDPPESNPYDPSRIGLDTCTDLFMSDFCDQGVVVKSHPKVEYDHGSFREVDDPNAFEEFVRYEDLGNYDFFRGKGAEHHEKIMGKMINILQENFSQCKVNVTISENSVRIAKE
jgi:hypothetical protein